MKTMPSNRNLTIYIRWIAGESLESLSKNFNLSTDSIMAICRSFIPAYAQENYLMKKNSFRQFKKYKRAEIAKLQNSNLFKLALVNLEDKKHGK